MLLEIAAWLGRAFWPLLRGLVPWSGPKLTLALIFALGAVIAIGAPAGYVWLTMRGEVKACERTCDLRWETKILRETQANDEEIDAAVEAGRSVPATPADRAERMRVCRQSPTCRDNRR